LPKDAAVRAATAAGDFPVDCVTAFHVKYDITFPNGFEQTKSGQIKIADSDCDATESDVMVRFVLWMDPIGKHMFGHGFPGTKTVTNAGTNYAGEIEHTWQMMFFQMQMTISYNLDVTEQETDNGVQNVIEGTFTRHMTWLDSDGNVIHEREWTADINGVEISE
jgi:hypothetical protein